MAKTTIPPAEPQTSEAPLMADGDPSDAQVATDENVTKAVALGKEMIAGGSTKADAAWGIFQILRQDARETVVVAFIEGAGLTEKGALTYWYNCRKKAGRLKVTNGSSKVVKKKVPPQTETE